MAKERLATLISGGGTTACAIIEACQRGEIPGLEVGLVLTSAASSVGMERVIKAGMNPEDVLVINPRLYRGDNGKVHQEAFGRGLISRFRHHGITVVTQNGWMPKTPDNVIAEYEGRIFNQHPGRVPEFGGQGMYGKRVHAATLLFKRWTVGVVRVEEQADYMTTEVIAQRVAPEFDTGEVVKRARVDILPDDTVEDLQQRALPIEHAVQIAMLQDFMRGTLKGLPKQNPFFLETNKMAVRRLSDVREVAQLLYPKG